MQSLDKQMEHLIMMLKESQGTIPDLTGSSRSPEGSQRGYSYASVRVLQSCNFGRTRAKTSDVHAATEWTLLRVTLVKN